MSTGRTAAVFLARGYEADHRDRFVRFLDSYRRRAAGEPHNLHVIFKGFRNSEDERAARTLFDAVPHVAHVVDDAGFDIGAYASILKDLDEFFVCFLNSHSRIDADDWLGKLILNLDDPAVGMVGATGSYESLNFLHGDFPRFPNPHLRTTAFALRVSDARRHFPKRLIVDKVEAWRFESGAEGLTRRFSSDGLACLVVGRDGCGYGPNLWPLSETYRLGLQSNLLVSDNVTRLYQLVSIQDRSTLIRRTWGKFHHPRIFRSSNQLSG